MSNVFCAVGGLVFLLIWGICDPFHGVHERDHVCTLRNLDGVVTHIVEFTEELLTDFILMF